ncbi:MAG: hypothetical protein IJT49_03120 [Clostridia bacterium]|nr:hypothetical protein [Clostridia bacterium]
MKKVLLVMIPLIIALTALLCGCGDNGEETAAETETSSGGMSYSESANEDEANFNDLFGE